MGRKCYKSDSDDEVNEDGDSIPGLNTRNNLDSDSDDESEDKNCESKDDDSMPDLVFQSHCYDSDSDAESKVGGIEAVYNLSEDTNVSLDDSKFMIKWLLDAGASIHADADGNCFEDEKSCCDDIR
jgi:hypothetical protein